MTRIAAILASLALIATPALTATPVPPPAHWYWVVENQTNNIINIH